MLFDTIPLWLLLLLTCAIVVTALEAGYRIGKTVHRHAEDEKESPVSTITGSILGLLAFILAFTFGIVTNRYDVRKELVRDEANVIRTAYLRSDFLPPEDHKAAEQLYLRYLKARIEAAHSRQHLLLRQVIDESQRVHQQLWDMAVANARKDLNSDTGALYVEAVNDLASIHAARVAVIAQRIPAGIWFVLYTLILLSMFALGYQTAIAGSRRTWISSILALAFSIVIAMIVALDRPHHGFITVSQQPLEALLDSMTSRLEPAGKAQ